MQDKFDLQRFAMNPGLRYGDLDPAGERSVSQDILKRNSNGMRVFAKKAPAASEAQISPRCGLAFPPGVNDKLHLNHGRFLQAPLFECLNTNLEY